MGVRGLTDIVIEAQNKGVNFKRKCGAASVGGIRT